MTWRHRALHCLRPFERDTRSKFVRMGSVNGQSVNLTINMTFPGREHLISKQVSGPVTPAVGLDQPVIAQHRNTGVPVAAAWLLAKHIR
jgi:hypothetical protein